MTASSSGSSDGMTFTGALTILFVGLKLGGIIQWSWWWVLSPLWISAGVAMIVVAVFIAIFGIDGKGSGP